MIERDPDDLISIRTYACVDDTPRKEEKVEKKGKKGGERYRRNNLTFYSFR